METVHASRRKWTPNPHQTVPDDLAAQLRTYTRQRRGPLGAALAACRDADWGVPALAVATGMSCDAVAQQICRARRAGTTTVPGLHIPAPELTADEHPSKSGRDLPNPALPPGCAEHLAEQLEKARQVRWSMPADHPARVAAEHLAADIALLLARGYRKSRITKALGVSYRAIDGRLERYGHRPPVASVAGRTGYILRRSNA